MDLSADRQTARWQLCSARPDYETQLISSPSTPKIDGGQLDCVLASVCVCVCILALYGYLSFFCVCNYLSTFSTVDNKDKQVKLQT